ncbi:MAG: hypothetical protein GXO81_14175 [Chlorobi bacterium]|nr:hypothetical protein [Chlorobiota bacterium]
MKEIISLFILITFSSVFVSAQSDKRNVIKFYPASPFFGKATLGYERVIDEKRSITFNLGLPTGVSIQSYLSSNISEGLDVHTGRLKGFLIMPGYRANLSKKAAPVGFYVEPYLKYEKFTMNLGGEFIDKELERFDSDIDGSYSGYGAGFQIGAQWLILDIISFDISFGPEAKIGTMNVLWADKSGEVDIDDVYNDLDDSFAKTPIIGSKMELTKGADYVKVRIPRQFIPGLRAAFSLGIAF